MKAFLVGVALMAIVSAGAAVWLQALDFSAQDVYRSSTSVRL